MKKTKRDIHKEIMYNKIMPTGHMKRNDFEEYSDYNEETNTPSVSFPEKAEVDPAEIRNQIIAEERKALMKEEEERESQRIDSENENIVKILSEKDNNTDTQEPSPLAKAIEELSNQPSAPVAAEIPVAEIPESPVQTSQAAEKSVVPEPAPVSATLPPAEDEKTESAAVSAPSEEKPVSSPIEEPNPHADIDNIIGTLTQKTENIPVAPKKEPVRQAAPQEPIQKNVAESSPRPAARPSILKKTEIPKSTVPAKPKSSQPKDSNMSVDDILNELPKNKPVSKPAPKTVPKKPKLPELVNINEVMINNKIDGILEKFNCCKCPACKMEVIATALNKLTPQYVIKKNEDSVNEAIESSNYAKINSALINAIITLRANPVHK